MNTITNITHTMDAQVLKYTDLTAYQKALIEYSITQGNSRENAEHHVLILLDYDELLDIAIKAGIALDIEQWLESNPHDGFATVEDSLNCLYAETGIDREACFDIEAQQLLSYELYLQGVTNENQETT